MPDEPFICVVDDDASAQDSLGELLDAAGYKVQTFSSAAAFLANPGLDQCSCLVSDVRMPGMDGLELQSELNRRGLRFPVIIITGHGDVPLAVRAIKEGAIDFLEKPFEDEVLIASIQSALAAAAHPAKPGLAPGVIAGRIAELTDREREVLDLLVLGDVNKVIGQKLGISFRTVEIHRSRIFAKMEARNVVELVRMVVAADRD